MANDADQSDDGLCDILRKAVEEDPWALHGQTNCVIEFVFSAYVEGFSASIHKYNANKEKNTTGDHIHYGDTLANNHYDSTSEEE